ncbi:MAG TPA: T9SS type B sorting domain-containing protein [Flavobacteriales bacterium]|nr:T9SS type B sorting domain-containing protein [Flavobacteriales bacterium]
MKITNIAAIVTGIMITSATVVKAQVVGPDVYMQGAYIEIGVMGDYGYEGINTFTSAVPAGYHQRGPTNLFGFMANPQMNNWDNFPAAPGTAFDGDFFTPGSPENGWGFEIVTPSGLNPKGSNNCAGVSSGGVAMSGSSLSYVIDPATGCMTQNGQYDYTLSGYDITFDITYKLKPNDVFYTTIVKVTNNGSATIPEFYYYRNVDPDNNQSLFGTFTTDNAIIANPTPTCNKAHVQGVMTNVASSSSYIPGFTWDAYLGFAAIGPNFKVSVGGFTNRDGSDIWNGTGGLTTTIGYTNTADEAISLAYQILNFAPGQTEEIKYVVILDAASADAAIDDLFYFDYTGSLGGPPPECVTIVDTALTCPGAPVTITMNGPVTADFTWAWSGGPIMGSPLGTSAQAIPTVPTLYTITGTSVTGCYNPIVADIFVDVQPGPDADYTDPGSQCNTFDLTTLTHTDLNAVPGVQFGFYSIPPATIADTGLNQWPSNIITPTDVVYLVYYDTALGCVDPVQVILTWGGVPATLNVTHPTCAGNDGIITAVPGVAGTFTYSLDGGAFVSSSTFTGLGLGFHQIEISDGSGCTTILDTILQNGALPVINSTAPVVPTCQAVCNGSITVSASGLNVPLQYSIDGGALQASSVLAGVCDGTHTVSVTDAVGCTVSTTVTLVANTFTVSASLDQTICIGQTTTISAVTTGGSGVITVDWDNGVPNGASQNVSPTVTTTYSVFATDGVGCTTNTDMVTINVNPPLAVIMSPNVTVCPGDTAVISATGSGGNAGPYNYVWTNNQDASVLFNSPNSVAPANSPTIYTVTVTDNCGTPAVTGTVTVDHFALPAVTYNIDQNQGCSPLVVNFQNTTANSGSVQWTFGDGGFGIGTTTQHAYEAENTTECNDVTLTVTTNDGCVVDTTIASQICVFPIPQPDFTWNPNPTDIFNVDIDFSNLTIGGTTYSWDFAGMGSSTGFNSEFSFPYDSGGVYPVCLVATSDNGCVAQICHDVVIEGVFLLYAPNAFTPDANGTNDMWLPSIQGDEPGSYELFIFNRWGEVVFKSTDKTVGWDGLHNSMKAKEDVYVWKIKVKSAINAKKYEYTGHVTLLR